jgi:hypothetical protein
MRRVLIFFTAIVLAIGSFATVNPVDPAKPALKASEVFFPVGSTGKRVAMSDLATMNVKEFELLSGKKMRMLDKFGFKIAQRELRKTINADGTVNSKKIKNLAKKMSDDATGFHIGGFALGFLLGLIGILIAYLINDDKKSNRVKWAWIGFGAWLIILLLLVI